MPEKGKKSTLAVKVFKWSGLLLLALFILFSVAPYLFSEGEVAVLREDLLFANSDFVEIEGIELHYRKWRGDNGTGKNVLLVHGLGASTFTWRYTAPMLEETGMRVVAVDLPGFGLSERKPGLDHSAGARGELLWVMLEEQFPGRQWHLVGHSMGGATVTAMALQNPEQTESLTLAAGALIPPDPSPFNQLLRYPPAAQWARVFGSRLIADESRVEEALTLAYGHQPTEHELSGYYLPLNIESTATTWLDLLKAESDPLLDQLPRLDLPVLCIWGEKDLLIPLEQGRKIDRLLPDSNLIILEGVGHCPMETAPDRFDRKLAEFLLGI